jgi:hypothetical protein
MNKRMLLGLGALVAVAALFAACGGDDDGGNNGQASNIRTQQGLSVAALVNQLGGAPGVGKFTGDGNAVDRAAEDGASGVAAPAPGVIREGWVGDLIAPSYQQSLNGITVMGFGSATADADSAVLEMYFSRYGGIEPIPFPEPVPPTDDGGSSGGGSGGSDGVTRSNAQQDVSPITEADLQPVIDALVGAGVPRGNIEFLAQGYFDKYYASATLRATVSNLDSVDGASQAADINFDGQNVSYTLQNCDAVEQAAMAAAVDDARARGASFAQALGVNLGGILGAANNSWSPYGGTPCASTWYGPMPLIGVEGGQAGVVEVIAQITVTYAIQ